MMTVADSVARWERERSFHHSEFPPERLAVERQRTAAVVIPTRQCAATIEPIVATVASLRDRGVIDELVVVDADSSDGTALRAEAAGATVALESELLPAFGPVRGKGDAMWRALSIVDADAVCYLDGDSGGFGEHFVCGTLGPLLCVDGVEFVKAHFRRPFNAPGGQGDPHGGGRVTELCARPLIRRFWPQLAAIRQPLAGETAAATRLLRRLPFSIGYAVELALLLDVAAAVHQRAIAQTDLDLRINDHQPLRALTGMADEVLAAAVVRLRRDGRLSDPAIDAALVLERPPMETVLGGG